MQQLSVACSALGIRFAWGHRQTTPCLHHVGFLLNSPIINQFGTVTRNWNVIAKGCTNKEVNKISKLTASVYKYKPAPSLGIVEYPLSLFPDHQDILESLYYLYILLKSYKICSSLPLQGIRDVTLLLEAQNITGHEMASPWYTNP